MKEASVDTKKADQRIVQIETEINEVAPGECQNRVRLVLPDAQVQNLAY